MPVFSPIHAKTCPIFSQAFANMTLAIRRSLCSVMVFAVVEKADTVVMNDGEELDSWSVIINGDVEIVADGDIKRLSVGDRCVFVTTGSDVIEHVTLSVSGLSQLRRRCSTKGR